MAQCNYNCATLPDHLQVDCSDFSPGGISAYALLECDHTIADFSSAVQWAANIASGKAKIALGVKGEIPAAAAVQVDNPRGCGAAQIPIGFDNPANIKDYNVNSTNDDLYAKVNKQQKILVLFECENNQIRVSNLPVIFTAMPVQIPEGNRVLQYYQINTTFFSKLGDIPYAVYDAPDGIFVED